MWSKPVARAQPGETECEGLPESAHRRQVETSGGGSGQVLQVDRAGDPERIESPVEVAARAKTAA